MKCALICSDPGHGGASFGYDEGIFGALVAPAPAGGDLAVFRLQGRFRKLQAIVRLGREQDMLIRAHCPQLGLPYRNVFLIHRKKIPICRVLFITDPVRTVNIKRSG